MAERSEIFNRLTDPPKKRDTAENRAQSAADFVLGAIRGAVKSVTTDLPGFLLDAADQLAGEVKSFGEKDRSEQMFSAVTGTKKGSGQAETVGSFVNPIAATQAMILPALMHSRAIQRAKALEKGGISPATIFQETGVYKEPQGRKYKTVVADDRAEIDLVNLISWGPVPLEDVLSHPTLYGRLPELQKVTINQANNELGAAFIPSANHIRIGSSFDDPETFKSMVLHETQHAVQKLGRMTDRGTSPEQMISRGYPDYQSAFKAYMKDPGEMEARFTERTKRLNQAQIEQEIIDLLRSGVTPSGRTY